MSKRNKNIKISTLENGMRVITSYKPIQSMLVGVFANVGADSESEEENGISHLLEHCAFKGTKTRSSKQIALEVEMIGADINAYTSYNTTGYYVNGLAEHVTSALNILSDVISNSVLDDGEITREKEVVIQEIYQGKDSIGSVAMEAFLETAFPNQPSGRPIIGTEENVRSFNHDTLSKYMEKHYHADNLILVGVGDLKHKDFVKEASALFSNIPASSSPKPEIANYVGGSKSINKTDYEQSRILIGFPVPCVYTPEFAKFDMLSDILGSGMSSPLFQEVREKRGLCYSVGAGVMPRQDQSLFILNSSTSKNNIVPVLTSICAELVKVANGIIEDDDWTRAQNQLKRQIVFQMESRMSTAQTAIGDLFYLNRVRTIDEIMEPYKALTKKDIIKAANYLLEQNPTVVIAGNCSKRTNYGTVVKNSLKKQ